MADRVTEKKRIKINRECVNNPVFLTWINTLGGREQWLFHTEQQDAIKTENRGTFEPTIDDLETARGHIFDLAIFAQPQITVYALVEREDLEGLKGLMYSPMIEVLVNPDTWQTDGPKWQRYRVEPGSFDLGNTKEERIEISITLNKPYIENVRG